MTHKIRKVAVALYIWGILGVFPLVIYGGYRNITSVKFYFFFYFTVGMFAIICLTKGYELFWRVGNEKLFETRKILHSMVDADWFMLLFLLSNIISFFLSDYRAEALWGEDSRYCGLMFLLAVGAAYYGVSRWGRFHRREAWIFLGSGGVVFGVALLQAAGFDLFGWQRAIWEGYRGAFLSTIGYINIFISYVGLLLPIAAVLFCFSRRKRGEILYFLYLIAAFTVFPLGNSDSAYLIFGTLFILIPILIGDSMLRMVKFWLMCAAFFAGGWLGCRIVEVFGSQWTITALPAFFGSGWVTALGMISCLGISGFVYWKYRKGTEKVPRIFFKVWIFGWGIVLGIGAGLFLGYQLWGVEGPASGLASVFSIHDEWGNGRGFVWKRLLYEYGKGGPGVWLFGFGPDTVREIMMTGYGKEMYMLFDGYFDSAHNEYLQILITGGMISLLAYVEWLACILAKAWKYRKHSPYIPALGTAILCYAVQALVNVHQSVISPIMFVFAALLINIVKNVKKM